MSEEILNNQWIEFAVLLVMVAMFIVPIFIVLKPHMTIEEIVEERERKEALKLARKQSLQCL